VSDIFLSYDSRDLEQIKPLAAALSAQGWTVFYDRTTPPGKTWRQFIGKEIDECHCMIVAWSNYSLSSHWVCEEADDGLKRQILVPLFLEQVTPPWGFRSIQAADIVDWQGDKNAPGFLALCRTITELIGTKSVSPIPPSTMSGSTNQLIENHRTSETTDEGEIAKNSKPAANSGSPINPPVSQSTAPKSKGSIKSSQTFIEPEMVIIPTGSFQMGSGKSNDEQPIHQVTINKPFALGKYPVTFDEYDNFAGATNRSKPDDNGWGRGKRPVINVNWDDANAYAQWLSKQTCKLYRLPSEAEWEYAARAGTTGDYYWSTQEKAEDFAWFSSGLLSALFSGKTHPVGEKKPNAFGLYDMAGNVWEWMQDCWHDNYQKAPADGSAWREGNEGECSQRVLRGGSWGTGPGDLRSATRVRGDAVTRNGIGFRLAQD